MERQLLQLAVDLPYWSSSIEQTKEVLPWTLRVYVERVNEYSSSSGVARGSASSDNALAISFIPVTSSNSGSDGGGSPDSHQPIDSWGVSLGLNHFRSNRDKSLFLYDMVASQLEHHGYETAEGLFSFLEHGSNYGYFSTLLAKKYPNATVVSLERDQRQVAHHLHMLQENNIKNNAVCVKRESDATILQNIVESPELFRFQLLANGLEDAFSVEDSLDDWGTFAGDVLSSALTTFLYVPPAAQVSLAMETIFGSSGHRANEGSQSDECASLYGLFGPHRALITALSAGKNGRGLGVEAVPRYDIRRHPSQYFHSFDSRWLLEHTRARHGYTGVKVSPLFSRSGEVLPYVRCDVANMTRRVHHHYDYSRDGHSRTYTMRILVNETLGTQVQAALHLLTSEGGAGNTADYASVQTVQTRQGIWLQARGRASPLMEVSNGSTNEQAHGNRVLLPKGAHPVQGHVVEVHLTRNKDSFPIPYTAIHGVTLISCLRLGLAAVQRDTLFESFLRLPLYEDMAPWNVILAGAVLDYIDYDTQGVVFDGDVPKAYRVMAVLMNYKRTVEDFRRCEEKAQTVYNLPFVSDCVGQRAFRYGLHSRTAGKSDVVKCDDLERPVPCADGTCHSDYISCLRSLSDVAEGLSREAPLLSSPTPKGERKVAEASQTKDEWSDSLLNALQKHHGTVTFGEANVEH